jgi:hypothetical protein
MGKICAILDKNSKRGGIKQTPGAGLHVLRAKSNCGQANKQAESLTKDEPRWATIQRMFPRPV